MLCGNICARLTYVPVFNWVRWSGTTLLSIQPHQEPRFLIPLVAPMVALVVGNGRILRTGRLFWVIILSFLTICAINVEFSGYMDPL